jgi:diguanylate cyclase (GGDEF)-like protein
MRQSVVESAAELKTAVRKMAEEGEQSVSQLRAEVANYRSKLEQSEKREAVDTLTGLANRREIEAQIEDRISWNRPFCLAILDLNEFKRINDVHGHMAGDDLLKQFAAEMKAQFRPDDVVGRWGGDEFVVVVDTDLDGARVRLDRVRQWAFGDYEISSGRNVVEVVVMASIGIAEWDGEESTVELMARADERMYAEKRVQSMPRSAIARSA